jgi:hypothetical protein
MKKKLQTAKKIVFLAFIFMTAAMGLVSLLQNGSYVISGSWLVPGIMTP